jgi:transcriptional regulator with XRE-family HTH domain
VKIAATQGEFMFYQRSLEIEQRLATALRLIRTGRYSTPKLAERLGVSIPTVSRYVTALRARGHDIRAEKLSTEWRFVLGKKQGQTSSGKTEPLPFSLYSGTLQDAQQ